MSQRVCDGGLLCIGGGENVCGGCAGAILRFVRKTTLPYARDIKKSFLNLFGAFLELIANTVSYFVKGSEASQPADYLKM